MSAQFQHSFHIPTQLYKTITTIISRPTPRLYSTPHTVWSAIDRTVEWTEYDHAENRSQAHELKKHATNSNKIYTVKIVNKRPRNLLNEVQNVFINGKQVKTAKITQIIP